MTDINKTIKGEVGIFNAMIASGPVIIQEREGVLKTLLVKHGDKPIEELKWKFCGGKIIKGSDLEANAIREAKEEIGVEVKLLQPLKPLVIWGEKPESAGDVPEVIFLIHYLAEISDEPVMGEQILAMQWFDLNDLPDDSAPNVKSVIAEYLKK